MTHTRPEMLVNFDNKSLIDSEYIFELVSKVVNQKQQKAQTEMKKTLKRVIGIFKSFEGLI